MIILKWIRSAATWLGGREPVVLLAFFSILMATWSFIALASEVIEGDTETFDVQIVRAMRQADDPSIPIGPKWVQETGRDATALGGVAWLVFFTLVLTGYMWLDRKQHMAIFLLLASGSGMCVSFLLKWMFSRPRPDVVPHLSHTSTSSFPSGHSMMSAVVYLTLGTLLATVVPRARLKIYILVVAASLSIIVGVSRVYLGVHYPTDVFAGWAAGLIWALTCWMIARRLQKRGTVESETASDSPKTPDILSMNSTSVDPTHRDS
ncbi:phosphatase PAP2 family protein [Thalassoroseus pseudoceratinae]|uniref:phosphatase PAP2 family protein n=1 Tax=Thalassoroseus pseudoceratinae TaxID=2713176 RepID=UPI0014229CE5|nr:phosphatase PAP2 family protein [Thalassoroseus pseudoceratinae]